MSSRKKATNVKAKWVKPEINTFNKKDFIQSGDPCIPGPEGTTTPTGFPYNKTGS